MKKKSRLTATVTKVTMIGKPMREAMYKLYARYYDSTDREQFLQDLTRKDWTILLLNANKQLCGFSTMQLMEFDFQGETQRAIFSGDTIVEREHWGQQQLAFSWIRLAGQIKAQAPDTPLYWFLIVKGHRTYRLLQAFTHHYYPNWREPTPGREQGLINNMASVCFADYYDKNSGIIHFPHSHGQLKNEWAEPDETERKRHEVQFFLERNPGYVNGDEMACLTELHPDNLRSVGRRLFLQGMHE